MPNDCPPPRHEAGGEHVPLLSVSQLMAWAELMLDSDGDFGRLPSSLQALISAVVDSEAKHHLERTYVIEST
jgi:hypothetical protein